MIKIKNIDEYFMSFALKEANKAFLHEDVPIGAVIVYKKNIKNKKMYDKVMSLNCKFQDEYCILSKAHNKRNILKDATAHAELFAIKKACKRINDFRLDDCIMFVNLEPCQMCAGAILQSRIKKLVIATKSEKSGSCGSIINILDNDNFNHKTQIVYGIMEFESKQLINNFFKKIRNSNDK